MSALLIFQATIKDNDRFQRYAKAVNETLAAFDGTITKRGRTRAVLRGPDDGHQIVAVLNFPDQQTMQTWYDSDAYQTLVPNRDKAIDVSIVSYDEIQIA